MSSQEKLRDGLELTGNFADEDNWYIYEPIGNPNDMASDIIPDCQLTVPFDLYHCSMAPISLVILLVLSLLVKRKKLHPDFWKGAPGLLSPMNFLEETQNKGLAIAVFGILFSSLCVLLLDNDPLPFISNSSIQNREYWKMLALLYYPAFYYPLLACATVQHRVGYLLGCLLSWCHCVLYIWQKVECPQSPKIYRYYSLLSYLPIILCLAMLSLWYPMKLVESFKGDAKMATEKVPGSSYYEDYLKHILTKRIPKKSINGVKPRRLSSLQSYLRTFVYTPQKGFQIPLKLALSLAMAVIAVYQVALLLLASFIPNIQIIRAGMTKEMTALFVQFGIIPSKNPASIPGDEELATAKHYIWSLEVCFISSLVVSCMVTFCMLLKSMGNHRTNLRCLYQGAVEKVFYRSCKLQPSQQSLVCWMQFTGFQISFACLALLIQHIVFFICIVCFTFLIVVPLQSGSNMHLFKIVVNLWPFWLTLIVSFIAQNLLVHYYFLERDHLPRELTNRRAFYIVTYMFFPINVLLGLMAGIWRMVISALYNIVHFCQLDGSLLNRGVERFDPGYRTYCQYLKIEVSQSHPVMKAFCLVLLRWQSDQNMQTLQLRDAEEGIKLMKTTSSAPKASKGQQNRVRWCLAYTLINNPSLLPYRKGALVDATANGTKGSLTKP
ncbi:receptor for retinol uptake STRA6 [Crotalus tigris]|uniref:receptor for retinol uptake STRA6 n=1 Tax=Crotalus tigris TaxID=88082 RepID=UPI00192F5C54|nr:receptor for retinol uptake STRA6 [Crotalus tigris]XP_039193498.1 receptor for retinol uptake STRA6 [Crotalus tigris]XP_039193499.1 receptor for retinol uptake STRA6 [Crotalus tigris]